MPRHALRAMTVAAMVAGAALVARFSGTAAGGADSSGYLNSARLLARGRLAEPVRAVPGILAASYPSGIFVPLGMRPGRRPATAAPTYPVGLPLHLAAASLLLGPERAPVTVNVLAWIAAVVLLYRLARLLALPRTWSVMAVLAFAVFPVTVLQSVRVMSDVLATAWCLAAAFFALRARKHGTYALGAGVSLSIAVLVRPTDALVAPALALAVGASPTLLAAAAAGAAPCLLGLGLYNLAEYGRAVTTGYTGLAPSVALANLPNGVLHLGRWLVTFLGAPAVALVGLGVVRAVRGDRRQVVLLTWAGAIVGFYSLYEPSLYGWWRLRFLLPAVPALILSALLAAKELLASAEEVRASRPALRRGAAAGLAVGLLWSLVVSGYWVVSRKVWEVGRSEDIYPRCVAWAERRLPPNAALVSMQTSGAVNFYGHLPIVRYDLLDQPTYARFVADAKALGIPLYALLFRNDRLEFERRWPGEWVRLDGLDEASLWQLKSGAVPAAKP
ncbi:MAG: hypothetical protein LAO05_00025 [Acidobacteriia bacterium]|nr:hypothetical protein [Terriglobia bacterium]